MNYNKNKKFLIVRTIKHIQSTFNDNRIKVFFDMLGDMKAHIS